MEATSQTDGVPESILLAMGLFGSYLSYRHGKKKTERKAALESARDERIRRRTDPVCQSCGYRLSKHSDDGQNLCPRYQ